MVGEVGMAVLSYPSLFDPGRSSVLTVNNWPPEVAQKYLAYSMLFLSTVVVWCVYFFTLCFLTAAKFQRMVYLQTRYRQLSFRFFFLQSILVAGIVVARCLFYVPQYVVGNKGEASISLQMVDLINRINGILLTQIQPIGTVRKKTSCPVSQIPPELS